MASIVLRSYGGMSPVSVETANNPSLAKFASNLDLRQSDFRPFPEGVVTGPPMTAGLTLYRFEKTGYWITRPTPVNFVRGPIPNDTTERTYYTGDGEPKVTDDTGMVRQLGVPASTVAPGVKVNVVSQYSTDDAEAAKGTKLSEISKAIEVNIAAPYVGLTDADLGGRFVQLHPDAPWNASFLIPGTMTPAGFVPTNLAHNNITSFSVIDYNGTTYGMIYAHIRGFNLVLNDAAMYNALFAVKSPENASQPLLTTSQIDGLIQSLKDALKPADKIRDAAIVRLRMVKEEYVALADTGSSSTASNAAAMRAFYARPEVIAATEQAVDQAVSAIYSALFTFNKSIYDTPGTGGAGPGSGGGGGGPGGGNETYNPM